MTLRQDAQFDGSGEISLVALGANLPSGVGPPVATLQSAVEMLIGPAIRLVARSRHFVTPCMPAGAGPDYVNAAVAVRSGLDPAALLERLHAVEAALGRQRDGRWQARCLDLDLIAVGEAVLPDRDTWAVWAGLSPEAQLRLAPDRLILPHPRMVQRAFVLVPLAEVAPHWRHPVTGRSVAQMLADLPVDEVSQIRPLDT